MGVQVRDIRIPSILIAKSDGDAFKEEISSGGEPVLVEVEWKMPSQWPVAVTFWGDPGDMQCTHALVYLNVHAALNPEELQRKSELFNSDNDVFALEKTRADLCGDQAPEWHVLLVLFSHHCSRRVPAGFGTLHAAPRGPRSLPDNIQRLLSGRRFGRAVPIQRAIQELPAFVLLFRADCTGLGAHRYAGAHLYCVVTVLPYTA